MYVCPEFDFDGERIAAERRQVVGDTALLGCLGRNKGDEKR